jgi:hypothetical protein
MSYVCWDCEESFAIKITDAELASCLLPGRTETCPRCRCPVGKGHIQCRSCSATLFVDLPHWHMRCDMFTERCSNCGYNHVSGCIC